MKAPAAPPPLPAPAKIVAVAGPLYPHLRIAASCNYSRVRRAQTQAITLHATGGHEGFTKDTDVAAMFADPTLKPRRSAHYVVDADSCLRCVFDDCTAWHCCKTGNSRTIGVELCGRADQTREQWLDSTSLATLQIAARLVAQLCVAYKLPGVLVDDRGLIAGERGITTHAFVAAAWHESKHTDPGPGFPLHAFVAAVALAMQG